MPPPKKPKTGIGWVADYLAPDALNKPHPPGRILETSPEPDEYLPQCAVSEAEREKETVDRLPLLCASPFNKDRYTSLPVHRTNDERHFHDHHGSDDARDRAVNNHVSRLSETSDQTCFRNIRDVHLGSFWPDQKTNGSEVKTMVIRPAERRSVVDFRLRDKLYQLLTKKDDNEDLANNHQSVRAERPFGDAPTRTYYNGRRLNGIHSPPMGLPSPSGPPTQQGEAPPIEQRDVAPPTNRGLAPPTHRCLAPPTNRGVAPPTHRDVAPPTNRGLAPPTHRCLAPPTNRGVAPPTHRGVAPPTHRDQTPPTRRGVAPPTHRGVAPPTHRCLAAPTHRGLAPPTHRGLAPPTHRGLAPQTHRCLAPPTYRGLAPPTYRGLAPPTYRGLAPPTYRGLGPQTHRCLAPPTEQGVAPLTHRGRAPPTYRGVAPPTKRGVALPSQQGVTPPTQQDVAPLAQRGVAPHTHQRVAPPTYRGVILPSQQDVAQPTPRGVASSSHRDMAPPTHRDQTPPTHRDMAPPSHRDMAPPTHRDQTPPTHRDITPPTHRDQTPPTHRDIASPTHRDMTQPTHRDMAPPTHRDMTPPTHREQTPPTHRDMAPLTHRDMAPPTHRDQTPPTHRDQTPPTHRDQTPPTHRDMAPPTHRDQTPPTHRDMAPPTHRDQTPPTHRNMAPPTHRDQTPPTHRDMAPPTHRDQTPPTYRIAAPRTEQGELILQKTYDRRHSSPPGLRQKLSPRPPGRGSEANNSYRNDVSAAPQTSPRPPKTLGECINSILYSAIKEHPAFLDLPQCDDKTTLSIRRVLMDSPERVSSSRLSPDTPERHHDVAVQGDVHHGAPVPGDVAEGGHRLGSRSSPPPTAHLPWTRLECRSPQRRVAQVASPPEASSPSGVLPNQPLDQGEICNHGDPVPQPMIQPHADAMRLPTLEPEWSKPPGLHPASSSPIENKRASFCAGRTPHYRVTPDTSPNTPGRTWHSSGTNSKYIDTAGSLVGYGEVNISSRPMPETESHGNLAQVSNFISRQTSQPRPPDHTFGHVPCDSPKRALSIESSPVSEIILNHVSDKIPQPATGSFTGGADLFQMYDSAASGFTDEPMCGKVDKGSPNDRDCVVMRRCQICEDSASGFHYGVWSCEGCKAFFKRSLQGPIDYVCPATNNCTIDKHRRKSCQACRLRKCLEMGMSRGNCRDKKASRGAPHNLKRKFTEDNPHANLVSQVKRRREHGDVSEEIILYDVSALDQPSPPDEVTLPQYPRSMGTPAGAQDRGERPSVHPLVELLMKAEPPVRLANHDSSKSDYRLELLSAMVRLMNAELVDIIHWANCIPGYLDLSVVEQTNLLEGGCVEAMVMGMLWKSLPHNGILVFAPDLHMTRERCATAEISRWMTRALSGVNSLRRMQIHREEAVLLRALILFNADGCCESVARRRVQDQLSEALHYTVTIRYGLDPGRVCRLLLLLPHIRQWAVSFSADLDALRRRYDVPMDALVQDMIEGQLLCAASSGRIPRVRQESSPPGKDMPVTRCDESSSAPDIEGDKHTVGGSSSQRSSTASNCSSSGASTSLLDPGPGNTTAEPYTGLVRPGLYGIVH